jgi:hypothetical protein
MSSRGHNSDQTSLDYHGTDADRISSPWLIRQENGAIAEARILARA